MHWARAGGHGERGVGHGDLVDIMPVRPKAHQEAVAVVDDEQVRVDQVPVRALWDADAAVVGPGAGVQGRGGGDADAGVLRATGRHGVVQVVGAVDEGDVWGPQVGVAGERDAGAAREDGALGGPGAGDGGRGGDGDFVEGLKTVAWGFVLVRVKDWGPWEEDELGAIGADHDTRVVNAGTRS